jgi:Domain of unknown function (DUF2383)
MRFDTMMTTSEVSPMQPVAARISGETYSETEDNDIDRIAALHGQTVDTLIGFEKMVEKAEPSFRPTAEEFRALHARHAEQLARLLDELGRSADGDGSFMGTVNKAVISLRSAFDAIDADVMDNVREGETHVFATFDTALSGPLAPPVRSAIRAMRDELTELVERTRHLGAA